MKRKLPLLAVCLTLAALIPNSVGAEERTLSHGGRERRYIIDKPPIDEGGAKLPVVIALHGGGGNGENARRMTGLTERVLSKGAILVYPDGTGRFARMKALKTWNARHCCGYAMENDVDDVGFISALIDALVAHDGADPKRIYVTGMSNGAMMAHRLGVELADKITAIAPVVGGLFGNEPGPSSPVAAIIINGALDHSVPLEGGQGHGRYAKAWDGTPLEPAAYQGAFWASANGCDPAPKATQSTGGTLTIERYTCPAGREVIRYVVDDGGHAWPGGDKGSPRGDEPSASLDATEVIWDFFVRQSK